MSFAPDIPLDPQCIPIEAYAGAASVVKLFLYLNFTKVEAPYLECFFLRNYFLALFPLNFINIIIKLMLFGINIITREH